MKRFIDFLAREPAMAVAVVLAALNVFTTLTVEQALHVETIVESILLLVGGGVVRQSVTPVAKLPPSQRG